MYLRDREDISMARLTTEGLRVSISDWILAVSYNHKSVGERSIR